ncbi:MAG: hypothetical protein ACE5GW_07765 [Planctomycetota bacterium]
MSRYRNPATGQVVALVAVIHVGELPYYRELQRELDRYDLVLFEMVGTAEEREKARSGEVESRLLFIAELQQELQQLLELDHQLDNIDYQRPNFRHADLSQRSFQRELRARGSSLIPFEALMRLAAPLLKASLALTSSLRSIDPQLTNRLRWQSAKMMADTERLLNRLGIRDQENPDDLIIGVRNTHAWKILQRSLPEGFRRTAIFYGAAHMPDFQRRLRETGWILEERSWYPAWRVPVPSDEEASPPPRRFPPEANL